MNYNSGKKCDRGSYVIKLTIVLCRGHRRRIFSYKKTADKTSSRMKRKMKLTDRFAIPGNTAKKRRLDSQRCEHVFEVFYYRYGIV